MCLTCRQVQKYVHNLVKPPTPRLGTRARALSNAETDALLKMISEQSSPTVYVAIALIALAGLRPSELKLAWRDIDFARRVITVGRDSKQPREVPISPKLYDILKARQLQERGNFVLDASGMVLRIQLKNCIQAACARMGVEPVSIHQLRYSYIKNAVVAGVPIPLLLRIVGLHKLY